MCDLNHKCTQSVSRLSIPFILALCLYNPYRFCVYLLYIIVFIKKSHNSFNLIDVVYSINTVVNMKGYYQFK